MLNCNNDSNFPKNYLPAKANLLSSVECCICWYSSTKHSYTYAIKGANFKPLSFHNDPNVRRILMLMGPATLGIAVTQFNVLIDRLIAIWIGDWAPAALFFNERMIYLPLGLIATALGTVLLPTFSEQVAKENKQALSETLIKSINHMLYIMVQQQSVFMV